MSTMHGERAEITSAEYAERRHAKRRWQAIQYRMDARAYLEHLAMLEPDEPSLAIAIRAQEERE